MNCEPIDESRWRLTLEEPEAAFLMNVLARLVRHYREDLDEVSPALRTFWQTGATAPAAVQINEGGEAGESREVLAESRAEMRSERRALAEAWLRDFELAEEPWVIDMTTAERDEFAAMLNDRRLILALESGLTGEEPPEPSVHSSEDDRRTAIMEIEVLGHFIMMLLGPQSFRP